MTNLKFKSNILKSSNKFILYKFVYNIFYQENKETLHKKACKRYQNLSEEEKEKKEQHGCEGNENFSEDEKQKLVEYRKDIEQQKTLYCNCKKVFLFRKFCLFIRKSIKHY